MESSVPHILQSDNQGMVGFGYPVGPTSFGGRTAFTLTEVSGDQPDLRRSLSARSGMPGGAVSPGWPEMIYPSFSGYITAGGDGWYPVNYAKSVQNDYLRKILARMDRYEGVWRWVPSGANMIEGTFNTAPEGVGYWKAANYNGAASTVTRATSPIRPNSGMTGVLDHNVTNIGSPTDVSAEWNPADFPDNADPWGIYKPLDQLWQGFVVAGTQYTLSGWVLGPVGGSAHFRVIAQDWGGNLTDPTGWQSATVNTDGSTWSYVGPHVITIPENCNGVMVRLYAGTTGHYYWSEIQLSPGAVPSYQFMYPRTWWGFRPMKQRACYLWMRPDIQTLSTIRDAFNFAIVCPDPTAYSATRHRADFLPNAGTTAINNNGDAPSYPRIQIWGPVTNGKVSNGSGWYVQLNLTIADGDWIVYDARTGRVTNASGTTMMQHASFGTDTFQLPEWSSNNIEFTGTGTGANTKARVTWRDAWNG